MNQLVISTVSGQTQPTIEFPTKNREPTETNLKGSYTELEKEGRNK